MAAEEGGEGGERSSSPVTYTYRALRAVFTAGLKGFYNTVEVYNAEAVPPPGECAILCPNHGNSLTDAISVVSQSPRMVRLTAKDNLWKDPIFGWWVRNVGTVPIKRRSDHAGKVDNSDAMAKLYEALQSGDMVCVFPEGVSRYQSGLAPLRPGVGRIVLEVLKREHEAGNGDFRARVVTCALTYLHREKFRSDLGVAFACPVSLRASEYPGLVAGEGGKAGAVDTIMQKVADQLRKDVVTAPDWESLVAGHTARYLHAPVGTWISLHQTIALTQRWTKVLSVVTEEVKEERKLARTASEPDIQMLSDHQATDAECAEIGKLRKDLVAYDTKRRELGVSDRRLRRSQPPWAVLVGGVAARAVWATGLLVLATPGMAVLSPLFAFGKALEIKLRMKCVGLNKVRDMDEVTQHKLAMAVFVVPAVVALGASVLTRGPLGLRTGVSCFVSPAWLWMTVRWLEDGVACLNACVELLALLRRKGEAEDLREVRRGLEVRVKATAEEHDLPSPETLKADAPALYKTRRFWRYFSPKRRRKMEWGEVVHMGHVSYDYPNTMLARVKTANDKDSYTAAVAAVAIPDKEKEA
ncbi:unnamed protein product [Pylaiella littoralis]